MKTPKQWVDHFTVEPMTETQANQGVRVTREEIAAIQADAFSAGERKGRIAGLREAANIAGRKPKKREHFHHTTGRLIATELRGVAERLERAATGKEGEK